jgi:Outer membrane protein beta-barrel domain
MSRVKCVFLLMVIPVMVAVTSSVQAQRVIPGRFSAGIFAGFSKPTGDFNVLSKSGWHAGGFLKADIVGSFDMRVDGTHSRFGKRTIELTQPEATVTTNTSVTFGTLGGVLNLGSDSAAYPGDNSVSPYLLLGAGYYRYKYDDTCTGACNDLNILTGLRTRWGIAGGGGASVPIFGFRTFIEARYHVVRVDGVEPPASMLLVSAGIKTK